MEPPSPGLGLFQPELRETRAQVVLRRLIEVTGEVSEVSAPPVVLETAAELTLPFFVGRR